MMMMCLPLLAPPEKDLNHPAVVTREKRKAQKFFTPLQCVIRHLGQSLIFRHHQSTCMFLSGQNMDLKVFFTILFISMYLSDSY